MKTISLMLLCFMVLTDISRAEMLADYNFNNNLSGGMIAAPDLNLTSGSTAFATENPFGFQKQVLLFDESQGLALDLSQWSLDDVFSLVMYLRIEDVNSYRKIIDFNERAGDSGLYVNSGAIELVQPNAAAAPSVSNNQYFQLVVTRDDSDQLKIYQDGVLLLDINEFQLTTDLANTPVLYFVIDDLSTNTENPSGALARLTVYNETLNQFQVDGLGIVDVIFIDDFQ